MAKALLARYARRISMPDLSIAPTTRLTPGQIKTDVLSGLTVALALVPEAVAFAFVAARCPAERRAQAISRLSVIGYAGFFLGPPLMGLVSGGIGLAAAFAVVALILLLIPIALIPWMRRAGAA